MQYCKQSLTGQTKDLLGQLEANSFISGVSKSLVIHSLNQLDQYQVFRNESSIFVLQKILYASPQNRRKIFIQIQNKYRTQPESSFKSHTKQKTKFETKRIIDKFNFDRCQ